MRTPTRLILTLTASAAAFAAVLVAGPAAGPAAAAVSTQDQTWMVAAHQGNLAEVAAGKAAVQKGSTDTVRELGQMLIDDHTALDKDLTTAAQQLNVTLPTTPSAAQQEQLAAVSAKSGAAFDSAWIASQIAGHRQALALGATEVAKGSDPTVKSLASASAPVVQRHLDRLVAVAPQYGVPTSVPGGNGGQAATSPHALGYVLAGTGAVLLLLAGVTLAGRRASRRRPTVA